MFDVGSLVTRIRYGSIYKIIDAGTWITTSNDILYTLCERKTSNQYVITENTLEELYEEYNVWKKLEKDLEDNGNTK